MSKTKNDVAWEQIFDKYSILKRIDSDSYFIITSSQINKYREARLMTKFDQKSNLPSLFIENNLSILPLTRGSYIIGKFDAYKNVVYDKSVQNIPFSIPSYVKSIDLNNIYSESVALHTAYVGGIINDLLEEESLQTISGRMSTGTFSYSIKLENQYFNVDVNNSQCEIDGGYESPNKLILVEAKNFKVDNFLIRQMYYPYRLWRNKVNKEILPVFFTYSADVFSFFVYKFNDDNMYNSLELIQQKNYIFDESPISVDDIFDILINTNIIDEPNVPFPQADNFERTIDLLGLLMTEELTKESITLNYAFEQRQTDYYTNSGIYLGLIQKKKDNGEIIYFLTPLGKKIMSQRQRDKKLSIVKQILEHEVFHKSLRLYYNNLSPITKNDVIEIMKSSHLHNVTEISTIKRRAQTVLRWIEWILGLTE
jgi:hypothetical protein